MAASAAYVRVNQVGYEAGNAPFRAYLMSTAPETAATFSVINSAGQTVYSGPIGALLGTWSNSAKLVYDVYALNFSVPGGDVYTISVQGSTPATSPQFAVDAPAVLYAGLLLNRFRFYETERDGPDYIPNALRTAPGHLNDESTTVFDTPPLNGNDLITTTGTPLAPTGAVIDGAGGWWDAGDYMKYVETVSYTTALMEIGVRDFPNQMGPNAPQNPFSPPASVSYAGTAAGAPNSSDFSAEAQFGFAWLMQMWDDTSKTLYYQVDNSQDWKHFPNLKASMTCGHCRRPPPTTTRAARLTSFIFAPAGVYSGSCRLADQSESCRATGRRLRRVLPALSNHESSHCGTGAAERRRHFRPGGYELGRSCELCGRRHLHLRLPAHHHALRRLSRNRMG